MACLWLCFVPEGLLVARRHDCHGLLEIRHDIGQDVLPRAAHADDIAGGLLSLARLLEVKHNEVRDVLARRDLGQSENIKAESHHGLAFRPRNTRYLEWVHIKERVGPVVRASCLYTLLCSFSETLLLLPGRGDFVRGRPGT